GTSGAAALVFRYRGTPMSASLDVLTRAGTAVIADVIDSLGLVPRVLDNSIAPVNFAGSAFAGPAYTITGQTHQWSGGGDRAKLAAIDGMSQGVVGLWAGGDIRGVCCFGDLLSSAMKARGCAGVVVDGGVRDVTYLRTLNLPILARYQTPAQAIGRWRVSAHQVPVRLRGALEDGVTVDPGDIVVADDDGVIVVAANLLGKTIDEVSKWSETESEARQEIIRGLPLLEALAKFGHL
ncbi:MAG: RraA family protein, partial [Solimonas sp.]